MTKLYSKLNLTKLFYISPQQNLYPPSKMTKLFPNSPGNYNNHSPTSESDQETITIIDPTRLALKYSQLVTQAYQGRHLWPHFLSLKNSKFFSGLKNGTRVPPITTYIFKIAIHVVNKIINKHHKKKRGAWITLLEACIRVEKT